MTDGSANTGFVVVVVVVVVVGVFVLVDADDTSKELSELPRKKAARSRSNGRWAPIGCFMACGGGDKQDLDLTTMLFAKYSMMVRSLGTGQGVCGTRTSKTSTGWFHGFTEM